MPLIFTNPYFIDNAFIQRENLVLAMDFEDASWVDLVNPNRTFIVSNAGAQTTLTTNFKINGTKSLSQLQPYATVGGTLRTPRTADLTFEGDFWIEFWAYSRDSGHSLYTGGDNWLMGYGSYSNTGLEGFYLDDLKLAFNVRNGSTTGSQIVKSTVSTTFNAWHHYAVGRKNGVIYLFLDGAVVASVNHSATIGFGADLTIGGYQDARNNGGLGYSSLNGYLDRLRIYKDRCLSTTNFTPLTDLYA